MLHGTIYTYTYIYIYIYIYMAMGHSLWLHFGVDEHPFATYFDAHQGYRVLTHSHIYIYIYMQHMHFILLSKLQAAGPAAAATPGRAGPAGPAAACA